MANKTEGAGYSREELEEHIGRLVAEGDRALWAKNVDPYSDDVGRFLVVLEAMMKRGLGREDVRGVVDRFFDLRPLMLTYVELVGSQRAEQFFGELRRAFHQHRI